MGLRWDTVLIEASNWKCRVTDMTISADRLSWRVVLILVFWCLEGCCMDATQHLHSLQPLGGERILNGKV